MYRFAHRSEYGNGYPEESKDRKDQGGNNEDSDEQGDDCSMVRCWRRFPFLAQAHDRAREAFGCKATKELYTILPYSCKDAGISITYLMPRRYRANFLSN